MQLPDGRKARQPSKRRRGGWPCAQGAGGSPPGTLHCLTLIKSGGAGDALQLFVSEARRQSRHALQMKGVFGTEVELCATAGLSSNHLS